MKINKTPLFNTINRLSIVRIISSGALFVAAAIALVAELLSSPDATLITTEQGPVHAYAKATCSSGVVFPMPRHPSASGAGAGPSHRRSTPFSGLEPEHKKRK
jgi:hypothetical protein